MGLPRPASDLHLDVPADARHGRLAGGCAAVAVGDQDEPHLREDVRLVVTELAVVLAERAEPDTRMQVRVWSSADSIVVEGHVHPRRAEVPALSRVSQVLLTTLVGASDLYLRGDDLVFRVAAAVGQQP